MSRPSKKRHKTPQWRAALDLFLEYRGFSRANYRKVHFADVACGHG